jgi:hypothetical protein
MTALTLSLFVPLVFADDPNNAFAPHDDALAAYFLYRCPDLHAVRSLIVARYWAGLADLRSLVAYLER